MHKPTTRIVVRLFVLIFAFQAHAGFAQTEADKRSSPTAQQRDGPGAESS
jgi:hypothetical protein